MTTGVRGGGSATGPTVLRLMLGAQLRRLRENYGITRQSAGWQIRSSESKISRMELGRVSFKERDVADLLDFYGVTDTFERDRLLVLAREANKPGWWQRYADVTANWFGPFLGYEAAANRISTYQVQFVPGLLQTAGYARSVIQLGHDPADPLQIDRRVELRMDRQRHILHGPNPPQFSAIIDEGALRRPVGGYTVQSEQLEALIGLTELAHLRLQVLGFDAGGHSAWGGSFTILQFPDGYPPDLVYTEHLNGAVYIDRPEEQLGYAQAMADLHVQATQPNETRDILESIRKDLTARSGP